MSDAPIHPPLGVILLAAGPSTRLGEPKQLVEVDGESLVCRSPATGTFPGAITSAA